MRKSLSVLFALLFIGCSANSVSNEGKKGSEIPEPEIDVIQVSPDIDSVNDFDFAEPDKDIRDDSDFTENSEDLEFDQSSPDFEVVNDMDEENAETENPDSDFEPEKELPVNFAVLSDTHISDDLSKAVFRGAIDLLIKKNPDFLIISGDITDNGADGQISFVLEEFKRLDEAGIEIYLIAGNHDLYGRELLDFIEITGSWANKNVAMESVSGSFSVKPAKGLKIIGFSASRDGETKGVVDGEVMSWITNELLISEKSGEAVIAFAHQNLVPHYSLEALLLPDMMIENYETVSKTLAENGLRLIFTGHAHATDIALKNFSDTTFIYDAETASLANFPSPVRFVKVLENGVAQIITERIESVDLGANGENFSAYSEKKLDAMLLSKAESMLKGRGFSDDEVQKSAPLLAAGMKAHVLGDESPDEETKKSVSDLKKSFNKNLIQAGFAADSFFTDVEPADNVLEVELH